MKSKLLKTKAVLASLLVLGLILTGCGGSTSSGPDDTGSDKPATSGAKPESKVKLNYWHHDGAAKTNPIFAEMFRVFMEENEDIEVEYLGLPSDSFFQKYLTAVATNTGPDVYGMRIGEVSSMVAQKALEPLDDYVTQWEGFTNLEAGLIDTARTVVPDGKLYMLPQFYNHDVSWYNTELMAEKGAEPPKTISQFLEYCEEFADPSNGKYFYTMRGTSGYRNTLTFLINYAGILGENNGFFLEDGTSIFRDPVFADALDAYASIYKNSWCSKDSITANYKEMVAEFGSGTSMYISHDSSSVVEHMKNMGEGKFMNAIPPANDQNGKTYILAVDPIGAAVSSQSDHKEAAFRLVSFLSDQYADSYHAQNVGKIPANKLVYEESWFKDDPFMSLYSELMQSENIVHYNTPTYLPEWKSFQTMTSDDLQAILLDKANAKEVLEKWAENLESWEKKYKDSL